MYSGQSYLGGHDLSEELVVMYSHSITTIDGFSLCQTLRGCRSQLAKGIYFYRYKSNFLELKNFSNLTILIRLLIVTLQYDHLYFLFILVQPLFEIYSNYKVFTIH